MVQDDTTVQHKPWCIPFIMFSISVVKCTDIMCYVTPLFQVDFGIIAAENYRSHYCVKEYSNRVHNFR